jgi:hypothetical protein
VVNAALQADYLFVGAAIRARLAEKVPELAVDGSVVEIEGLEAMAASINAPTVFVAWDADLFEDADTARAAGGRNTLMRQVWNVIVVARNAAQGAGAYRDNTVGALLAKVQAALAGFEPTGAFKPLLRVQGRRAQYSANTGVYPLAFQIQLSL